MKICFILALVAVVAAQDSTYTNKFDNVDVDEVIKSDRLFKNYYNCLVDAGACAPDAMELKKLLPDALENNCAKCTPKQRESRDKVIKHLANNRPEEWVALKVKYDPNNKFVEKYSSDPAFAGVKL